MDIPHFPKITPPQRLLMGPGPINADPRVLRAMSSQLVGQYDPAMTHYMNEVMALYRGVFRTENRWTMLVDGTSRAGIEAILLSAIRPGDKGEQRFAVALLPDASLMHKHHAVAHFAGKIHFMGDEDQRHTFRRQLLQHLQHILPAKWATAWCLCIRDASGSRATAKRCSPARRPAN